MRKFSRLKFIRVVGKNSASTLQRTHFFPHCKVSVVNAREIIMS